MALAPDIADLLRRMEADPTFQRPSGDDVEQARRDHEMDAVRFTPLRQRPPVATIENTAVPGPAGAIPVRVYRPAATAARRRPTLLWIHGGGWVTGSLETGDIAARVLAEQAELVVLSVDYRLAPEHPWPAGLDDVTAVLRWAHDHVGSLGGDPSRIAVGGDSAGGNLAAVAAHTARDLGIPLAAQLLVYPVVDADLDTARHPSRRENAHGYYVTWPDIEWCVTAYLPSTADPHDPRISPLYEPDLTGLAPAVVLTAEYDTLRDEGDAYASALESAGVPVTHLRLSGLVHGALDMAGVSPTARDALSRAATALRRLLDPVPERNADDEGIEDGDLAAVLTRYVHPGKSLPLARFPLPEPLARQVSASVAGVDEPTHQRIAGAMSARVREAAHQFLTEPAFRAGLTRLPFAPGERIVALGDSITDDLCSWAEQLRAVLDLVGAGVEVVNAGVTGDTTHDALARIDLVAAAKPAWVIQLLGTNDARRHGAHSQERLISLTETVDNYAKLGRVVAADVGARLVRMTPPPVVEDRAARWAHFRDQQITWRTADVREIADAVVGLDPQAVDVHRALGRAGADSLLLPDGVHPTTAGQSAIVRALVDVLASWPGHP
ncbi:MULTISPECIES: alpha/beta hydrolase fold domain-containing protein [unclassified Micromonospora]|uniref:alpha/beta hydrolase fold domain-containing protein n=1 Tax=unclassified Micromonospora TaxID=2617518 RepID=UPI0036307E03